jgi:hypothetical protein
MASSAARRAVRTWRNPLPVSDASGDELADIHLTLVVDCLPQLRSCFEANQPDKLFAMVHVAGQPEVRVGFATTGEIAESLLDLARDLGSEGLRAFAAELLALSRAAPGFFHCVVVYGGLSTVREFDNCLLG